MREVTMDLEAQFLESRAQRQLKSSHYASSRAKSERLGVFWSTVRQEIGDWKERLEIVLASQQNEENKTSQRTQLKLSLAELQGQLDALRKHCLSTDTTTSSTNNTTSLDWEVPDDIPATDVRLLHTELTQCAMMLEEAREKYLPRAKFVFHRYRKAMQQKQAMEQQQQSHSIQQEKVEPQKEVSATSTEKTKSNNPLKNLSYLSVRVQGDGSVEMIPVKQEDATPQGSTICSSLPVNMLSAPVLQNIENSRISLDYNGIREFHMVNVSHSTIRIDLDKVQGAVHVTKCHNVQLHLHSFHQLRIHESSNVQFHVSNGVHSGGVILEDSSLLVFSVVTNGKENDDPLLDVKDFNWLRNNVPSPNFRIEPVVVLEGDEGDKEHRQTETPLKTPSNDATATDPVGKEEPALVSPPSEEDSDDEL